MKKNKIYAILVLLAWLGLIAYVLIDPMFFEDYLTPTQVLMESSFVRTMFMDIGALSTLSAIWIYFSSTRNYRYFFVVTVLFVGSFALLPYVALWLYSKPGE